MYQAARETVGPDPRAWRINLRVDDNKRGEDVELRTIAERLGGGNKYNKSEVDTSRRDESLTAV